MKQKRTVRSVSLRFVDRKTGKHLSNRTLSKAASVSCLASADLSVTRRPELKVGIGSLFPILDTDILTKIRLTGLLKRYRVVKVEPRGVRYGGFKNEWQSYLLSDDGAVELLRVFFKYYHSRKMKLVFFCNWLSESVANEDHPAFDEVDQLCPALSIKPPASSTIRKLLSSEKPALYYMLVPSKLLKKVAR